MGNHVLIPRNKRVEFGTLLSYDLAQPAPDRHIPGSAGGAAAAAPAQRPQLLFPPPPFIFYFSLSRFVPFVFCWFVFLGSLLYLLPLNTVHFTVWFWPAGLARHSVVSV